MFRYCFALKSIKLPDTITVIEQYAFANCKSLGMIEIPVSVATMGSDVFFNCEKLTDIYCEAKSQPEGWATDYYDDRGIFWGNWNDECSATIHWGENMPPLKKGDVNGNDSIDSMDYVLLKRAYFGTYQLNDISVGDINGNETIDSMDYVLLKRAYFGTYEIK